MAVGLALNSGCAGGGAINSFVERVVDIFPDGSKIPKPDVTVSPNFDAKSVTGIGVMVSVPDAYNDAAFAGVKSQVETTFRQALMKKGYSTVLASANPTVAKLYNQTKWDELMGDPEKRKAFAGYMNASHLLLVDITQMQEAVSQNNWVQQNGRPTTSYQIAGAMNCMLKDVQTGEDVVVGNQQARVSAKDKAEMISVMAKIAMNLASNTNFPGRVIAPRGGAAK